MRCGFEVASIRAEPDDAAEQVTQALVGEPLRVIGRREGWARIVTAYDYPGWVRDEALEEGPGAFPEPAAAAPFELAHMLLGSPYEWGGLSGRGIDCSGLVHLAFRLAGMLIPRDAWQQEERGTPVPNGNTRLGDLAAYGLGARADHIAFWVGDGRILHSTGRNRLGVVIELEPPDLAGTRRRFVRIESPDVGQKEDADAFQTRDSR